MIEVEILARNPAKEGINNCILVHYLFRTRPEMSYTQEYQRGPIHVGRIEINFRAYAWTDKEIDNYKKMREQEDFQLLGVIDSSVKAAMEALGDELMRYLREAGEEMENPSEDKRLAIKEKSSENPYISIFKGFSELFVGKKPEKKKEPKPKKTNVYKLDIARKAAGDDAKKKMWIIYHHFKKHHGMLNW